MVPWDLDAATVGAAVFVDLNTFVVVGVALRQGVESNKIIAIVDPNKNPYLAVMREVVAPCGLPAAEGVAAPYERTTVEGRHAVNTTTSTHQKGGSLQLVVLVGTAHVIDSIVSPTQYALISSQSVLFPVSLYYGNLVDYGA